MLLSECIMAALQGMRRARAQCPLTQRRWHQLDDQEVDRLLKEALMGKRLKSVRAASLAFSPLCQGTLAIN